MCPLNLYCQEVTRIESFFSLRTFRSSSPSRLAGRGKKAQQVYKSILSNTCTPDHLTYGVKKVGDRCLIIMNMIALRARLDGLFLLDDCYSPSGFLHRDSWYFNHLPVNIHSSMLATELIQSTVLEQLLASYFARMDDLKEARDRTL